MKMVEICLQFLKAECTGDWPLRLDRSRMILPYFADLGHHHYQKSVYLYLQRTSQIHVTHPGLHKHFMNGLYVIRTSDRFWADLSQDLVVEQVLMCSLKTSGGLTRGRGMSERQRAIWLLSMPVTAEVKRAMQDFTGTKYQTSHHHKDTAQARITRDHSNGLKVLQYLQEIDPFTAEENPINLATGKVVDKSVNVHQAFKIGEKLNRGMSNQLVFSFSFKCKDMVVPMKTKSLLSIEGEKIHVDSALLFQRFIVIYSLEELSTAFGYELSTRPMSLFEKDDLMNETDKPKLKHVLSKLLPETVHVIPPNSRYVLDGGLPLHKVLWTVGDTFAQI